MSEAKTRGEDSAAPEPAPTAVQSIMEQSTVRVVALVLSTVVSILFIRKLEVETYGSFILVLQVAALALTVGSLGADSALSRFVPYFAVRDREKVPALINSITWTALLGTAVSGLAALGALRLAGATRFQDVLRIPLLFVALTLVLALVRLPLGTMRGSGRFLAVGVFEGIIGLAQRFAPLLVALTISTAYQTLLFSQAVIIVLVTIVAYSWLKHQRLLPSLRVLPQASLCWTAVSFGGFLVVADIVRTLGQTADPLMLKAFWGAKQVGLYSAVYTIPNQIHRLGFSVVSIVMIYHLSRATATNYERIGQGIRATSFLGGLLASCLLSGRSLLVVLLGSKYQPSVVPLGYLALFLHGLGITPFHTPVFMSQGKTRNVLFSQGAGVLARVGLCLLLIPRSGVTGAAISDVLGQYVGALAGFALLGPAIFRGLGARWFMGHALAAVLLFWLVESRFYLAAPAAYLLVIVVTGAFTRKEFSEMKHRLAAAWRHRRGRSTKQLER